MVTVRRDLPPEPSRQQPADATPSLGGEAGRDRAVVDAPRTPLPAEDRFDRTSGSSTLAQPSFVPSPELWDLQSGGVHLALVGSPVDREQRTAGPTVANNIVRFSRTRPAQITSDNLRPTLESLPVSARPVAGGSQLQFLGGGPLGQAAISPRVLTAGSMSDGDMQRLLAATSRVQATERYLQQGGHLVFQATSSGNVATHFPPGTGGPNGLLAEDYQALVQQPNTVGTWSRPAGEAPRRDEAQRLGEVLQTAEREALGLLRDRGLLLQEPLRPAFERLGEQLGGAAPIPTRPRPGAEAPPPSALSRQWSQAVNWAREENRRGVAGDPPNFVWPMVQDGQIVVERRLPSQIPTGNERRLLDVGLSRAPDGLLARGLGRELELTAQRFNQAWESRTPPYFAMVEGRGVDQRLEPYYPSQITERLRSGQIGGRDLERAGLSTANRGLLAEALEQELSQIATRYNRGAADRPSVAFVVGSGIDRQAVRGSPTQLRDGIRSGEVRPEELYRVGLSTRHDGLLAASLRRELGAAAVPFNREFATRTPPTLAVIEGRALEQGLVARLPSEVMQMLESGLLTEHQLSEVGLSTSANGILAAAIRKERLDEMREDPSEEAQEIRRILANPDSDSAGPLREAIEAGHAEALKRYVAANGTDGIGSHARALLDGRLGGAGAPPGTRPPVGTGGEPADIDRLILDALETNPNLAAMLTSSMGEELIAVIERDAAARQALAVLGLDPVAGPMLASDSDPDGLSLRTAIASRQVSPQEVARFFELSGREELAGQTPEEMAKTIKLVGRQDVIGTRDNLTQTPSGTVHVLSPEGRVFQVNYEDGRHKHTRGSNITQERYEQLLAGAPATAQEQNVLRDLSGPNAERTGGQLTREAADNYHELVREALEQGLWVTDPSGATKIYHRFDQPVGVEIGDPPRLTNWVRIDTSIGDASNPGPGMLNGVHIIPVTPDPRIQSQYGAR